MTTPRTPVLVGYGQVNQRDEDPERRTDRSDGGGGPRGRRPTGAGGRRLRTRRQHPVLALPRSRPAARTAHPRQRRRHPLHGRRRQCAADAGQPGVPGHPGRPRGPCADRGRRNLPHPNAIAQPRQQAGLDESRRVGAVRRGRQRSLPMVGPGGDCASTWTGPRYVYPLFEQALRIEAGESPDAHRRRIGELWSQFSDVAAGQPVRLEPKAVVGRADLAAERRQPDDQLALHQADELQQHGRSGRGHHPGLRREGDPSADPHRALGFPLCGHRCARHVRDR